MANFAKLDENNIVTEVFVVDDSVATSESAGVDFLTDVIGAGNWKQCPVDKGSVGYTYNTTDKVFVEPQPYPSWTLDASHDWQPPVAYPADYLTTQYEWDETNQEWNGLK